MDNLYLLIKYYQKEVNADEKSEVQNWLSESDDNRIKYEQYIMVWKTSEKVKLIQNIDYKSDWEKITRKAGVKQKPLHKLFGVWTRIAAVLIVAIGLLWIFKYNDSEVEYIIVKNESKEKIKLITLNDGTKVTMNYGAELRYPVVFSKECRDVDLAGNAFFEVTKNNDKPFIVKTSLSEIKVLGTSFDVESDKMKTVVTLLTGKVRVSDILNDDDFVELNPNEQAIHLGTEINKKSVHTENIIGWKTGVFRFNNHSLIEVMRILERRFHFQYHFKSNELETMELTADFNGETLDDIIKIIQLSCQVKIENNLNQLIIRKDE